MDEYRTSRMQKPLRKPRWLKRNLGASHDYEAVRSMIRDKGLHTVCQEARCPNLWHCFSKKTATFLIMGNRCTRSCRFCAIEHGPSKPPDRDEPARVAETVAAMGLHYVVITSVTRDDLADGGASCFAHTINAIKDTVPHTKIEILIPDFQGDIAALTTVLNAGPTVLNHNIETVPRLYHAVRPGADYERSLSIIEAAGRISSGIPVKSGIMLGLGETSQELLTTMKELYKAGCSILTLGQYLQPTVRHLPVERYIPPDEFDDWGSKAMAIGFSAVASGPFVRSSFDAASLYRSAISALARRHGEQRDPDSTPKFLHDAASLQKSTRHQKNG